MLPGGHSMSLELITMCVCQRVAKIEKAVGNIHG